MPTPSERLQRIIDAYIPSEMVFKPLFLKGPLKGGEALVLEGVITKKKEVKELTDDVELQKALSNYVSEHWSPDAGKHKVDITIHALWLNVKNSIQSEYESISRRCDATKRKTLQFIRDIKIEDKYLPAYLLQVFLKIHSPSYGSMSSAEHEALFEQFESLRRTYGKRD